MSLPTDPIQVFIGYDSRQPCAHMVAYSSILRRCSVPVMVTPLRIETLPITRTSLTQFTFSRFLVPHLCGYRGRAVFMDSDVLVLADLAELVAHADPLAPVSVVKNPKHQFEWPSVMVFNNNLCRALTPDYVQNGDPFSFEWARGHIGELPDCWNHLVGYSEPRPDAKLVHFTQGIPCFPETGDVEYAGRWKKEFNFLNSTVSWKDIMGQSVHAKPVLERLAAKAGAG